MQYIDGPLQKKKKERKRNPCLIGSSRATVSQSSQKCSLFFYVFLLSTPSSCLLFSPETKVTYWHMFSSQNINILNKLGTHLTYLYQVFKITFSYQLNWLLCNCHICWKHFLICWICLWGFFVRARHKFVAINLPGLPLHHMEEWRKGWAWARGCAESLPLWCGISRGSSTWSLTSPWMNLISHPPLTV